MVRYHVPVRRRDVHGLPLATQDLTRLSSLEMLTDSDLADVGVLCEDDRQALLQGIETFSSRTRQWAHNALASPEPSAPSPRQQLLQAQDEV